MLIYFLLIVVTALLAAMFLGVIVYGIFKKKKRLIITATTIFVVASLVCIFCSYMYVRKSVTYINSEAFQKDVKKGAEFAGQTIGSTVSGVSKGLGTTLDDDDIAAIANKTGTIFGKAIKATASGLDSTLKTSIFTDTSIANAGFQFGRAEEVFANNSHDLGLFISFTKNFKGRLKLFMYDQEGKKMDIAEIPINEKAGIEKVVRFAFSAQHDGITTYYILSKL